MLADRDYMRRINGGPHWSVTVTLLVINGLVYLFQYFLLPLVSPDSQFEPYFALSLEGLRHGYIWQLLTYQFMHGGFWHLFLNCWAIYMFGRVVEAAMGKKRMLFMYLLSGVMGGLLQMLCSWVWPGHFGDAGVVGASAGAFGLVAAFGVLFPHQRLVMLLFFVIPIAMRARTLLWLSIGLAVLGMIVPYSNIGHAAHLGGALTGVLFAEWMRRGSRVRPMVDTGGPFRITPAAD